MRDDDAFAVYAFVLSAQRIEDVLVGQPVEAVATNSLVIERSRQGCQPRKSRQSAMKGRVE